MSDACRNCGAPITIGEPGCNCNLFVGTLYLIQYETGDYYDNGNTVIAAFKIKEEARACIDRMREKDQHVSADITTIELDADPVRGDYLWERKKASME